MKVSVLIMTFNEEKNIPALFASLKGIDEIVVVDHESTDKTVKLAKKLGATVYVEPLEGDYPTKEEIDEFRKRYLYPPSFRTDTLIFNSGGMKNKYMKLVRNDWTLWIDADERLEWDFDAIGELMKEYDAITCPIYWRDTNDWINCVKLARNSTCWWYGRLHETLTGGDVRNTFTDKMKIRHFQEFKPYRVMHLPGLEYSALKDQDTANYFYLAREWMVLNDIKKAIYFFNMFLKQSFKKEWIALAFLNLAKCYFKLDDIDKAQKYCFQAIKTDIQNSKDSFILMAEMTQGKDKHKWMQFANLVGFNRTL